MWRITLHKWHLILYEWLATRLLQIPQVHDDVIKWKYFLRYWPFVWGIHRWPVNSPPKGQWHGALMFSLICARTNEWVNNRDADDFRPHRAHYGVIVMRHDRKSMGNIIPTEICNRWIILRENIQLQVYIVSMWHMHILIQHQCSNGNFDCASETNWVHYGI